MSYELRRRQIVGGTISEVFAFFKDPGNLEVLTPEWLGFRVTGSTDSEVKIGTRIRYQLRLHGVPLHWESRITEFVDGVRFADEQISGPYKSWYHVHDFQAVEGGVAIDDIVSYRMPFGILGKVAHAVAVQNQLRAIFDYRALHIGRIFPCKPASLSTAVPS